jgi:hypothetical protein
MNSLFEGFWPLLTSVVVAEAEPSAVADWWRQANGLDYRESVLEGSAEQLLSLVPPLTAPVAVRELFVRVGPDWCAHVHNGRDRGNPHFVAEDTSRRLDCRAIGVSARDDTLRDNGRSGIPGGVGLSFYEKGSHLRAISAIGDYDGRWEFEETGTPLPFEDIDRYRATSIRERLTVELAENYVREWTGVGIFFEDSYGPDGVLLTRTDAPVNIEESLAEAQAVR